MLVAAIFLAVIGVFVLAYAVHGRVVARGRFCRRCRFDLAGLNLVSTCPECGREVQKDGSTRTSLRRMRRIALCVAVLVLVLSATCFAFASPNISGRVVASLPEGPLIRLARLGFDGPLSELADRTGGIAPISARGWNLAIDAALARYGDRSVSADPRWAAVLLNGLESGRLTPEQTAAYVTSGLEFRARIRDRTPHGSGVLAFRIEQDSVRLAAPMPNINGKLTSLHVRYEPVRAGWVGAGGETAANHDLRTLTLPIWIPAAGTRGTTSRAFLGPSVRIDAPWDQMRPGQAATAFIEYDLSLIPSFDAEAIPLGRRRFEQRVRILPPDEQVVTVHHDEAVRAMLQERMAASVLKVMLPSSDPDEEGTRGANHMAYTRFTGANIPRGIAGRVSVRIGDQEWPLGDMMSGAVAGNSAGSDIMNVVTWLAQPDEMDRAVEIVRRWLDAGTVDLIFRTDPAVAMGAVTINEVHHADLIWKDVEVRLVGRPSRGLMFSSADPSVPASPDPPPPGPSGLP